MISQLYPESWMSTQSGEWSRYQIATTVRKENETASSSIYDAAHPGVLRHQLPVNCRKAGTFLVHVCALLM